LIAAYHARITNNQDGIRNDVVSVHNSIVENNVDGSIDEIISENIRDSSSVT